jgi:hypothetical protein
MRGGIASLFDVMTSRIQQAKRVRVHESSALGIYAKTAAIVDFKEKNTWAVLATTHL